MLDHSSTKHITYSHSQNGVAIPGSVSNNLPFTPSASQYCVLLTDGWSLLDGQICIVDSIASRILQRDTVADIFGNAPEECTEVCDRLGFAFAGTEFGAECHCGTGLTT